MRHLRTVAIVATFAALMTSTAACSSQPDIVAGSGSGATTAGGADAGSTATASSMPEDGSGTAPGDGTGGTGEAGTGTSGPEGTGGSNGTNAPGSSSGGGGGQGTDDVADGQLVVVIDGWSYASLDVNALRFTGGGFDAPVRFRPATAADLTALTARRSDTVQLLAGRMVSASTTMTCSTTACSWGERSARFDDLVDARSIPGLGESYRGYEIGSLAYVATLPAANGRLRYGTVELAVAVDIDDGDIVGPLNGGVEVIGAAFGRLFPLETTWNAANGGTPRFYDDRDAGGVADVAALVNVQATGAPLAGGLGAYVDALAFTPSQLTFMSSPTTGCGIGVLCVPGVFRPDARTEVSEPVALCAADGTPAGSAVFATFDVTATYRAPTHQFGMNGGATPDGLLGQLWETPPLSTSPSQRHIVAYHVDAAGLVDVAGLSVELGVDDGAVADTTLSSSDVGRLFGSRYNACGN